MLALLRAALAAEPATPAGEPEAPALPELSCACAACAGRGWRCRGEFADPATRQRELCPTCGATGRALTADGRALLRWLADALDPRPLVTAGDLAEHNSRAAVAWADRARRELAAEGGDR